MDQPVIDEASGAPLVLAFDVGGTTVKAEVLDRGLRPLAATAAPTPHGDELVGVLAATGKDLLGRLGPADRERVRRVGLVIPGIVDVERGIGVYSANVGLRSTPVSAPLMEGLGLPVTLGHDVTAAAEAERRHGAAAGVEDPVVVIIGTGIAAVAYVRGRRVSGVTGQAGELGHIVVRPDGPVCGCGARGCLEAVSSAAAIVRAYERAGGSRVYGARDVVDRLDTDPVAARVWQEAAAALADGLLAVAGILAPGAIVLGGGLAEAGDVLLDPVSEHLSAVGGAITIPPLLVSGLGSRAGVVGAGLLAIDRTEQP